MATPSKKPCEYCDEGKPGSRTIAGYEEQCEFCGGTGKRVNIPTPTVTEDEVRRVFKALAARNLQVVLEGSILNPANGCTEDFVVLHVQGTDDELLRIPSNEK